MSPQPTSSVLVAHLFMPEIKYLLECRNFKDLKKLLLTISIIDFAEIWEEFEPKEQILIFRLLSDRDATTLFQELELDQKHHILNTLGHTEIEDLLEGFNPEEAVRLFHKLPDKTVRFLKRFLEAEDKKSVEKLLTYPDNTVGSWIHIQRVDLHPHLTAAQAISKIRAATHLKGGGSVDGYYVTDKSGKVLGRISLRKLISAPSKMKLGQFMTPVRLLRLDPRQDQEEAVRLFSKYKLSMAPIVDKEDKLLGFIQAEDIIPLVEEEVTEDFAKMAGTESRELETKSVWSIVGLRFPWLIATCIGQLLVAAVIHHFDFILSEVIALAVFMPFILAMGGNVGSQSSTILVRGLAINEFKISDRWKILMRETFVGVFLGIIYGLIIGVVAFLFFGNMFGPHFAVVVGLATLIAMTVATMIGVLGPLTLVQLGVDPATATGPIVTTTTDIIGTFFYFVLAVWLLL